DTNSGANDEIRTSKEAGDSNGDGEGATTSITRKSIADAEGVTSGGTIVRGPSGAMLRMRAFLPWIVTVIPLIVSGSGGSATNEGSVRPPPLNVTNLPGASSLVAVR